MNKIFLVNLLIISLCSQTSFAAWKHSKKTNNQWKQAHITGIISDKVIKLSGSDFDNAISSNIPLVTPPIVQICIYTPKHLPKFIFTITANKKNISSNDFVLYNRRLGKVKTHIELFSVHKSVPTRIYPYRTVILNNHSDYLAEGKNCSNPVFLRLVIEPDELRKAYAGTYRLSLKLFANKHYT